MKYTMDEMNATLHQEYWKVNMNWNRWHLRVGAFDDDVNEKNVR